MKKILAFLLSAAMIFALASCGGKTSPSGNESEAAAPTEVAKIDMTEDQQYSANTFISAFAEQGFSGYDKKAAIDPGQLMLFAFKYNNMNNNNLNAEYVQEGDYNIRFSLKYINDILDRFFGLTLTEEQASALESSPRYSFKDGNFYINIGDGEAHTSLAIVDSLTSLSDGTYKMHFKIYALDLDVYYDNNGISKKYYQMTGEQADTCAELEYAYDGTAVASPYNFNGVDTYQLSSIIINY